MEFHIQSKEIICTPDYAYIKPMKAEILNWEQAGIAWTRGEFIQEKIKEQWVDVETAYHDYFTRFKDSQYRIKPKNNINIDKNMTSEERYKQFCNVSQSFSHTQDQAIYQAWNAQEDYYEPLRQELRKARLWCEESTKETLENIEKCNSIKEKVKILIEQLELAKDFLDKIAHPARDDWDSLINLQFMAKKGLDNIDILSDRFTSKK